MSKMKKPKHGGYPNVAKKPEKFLTPERMERLKDKIIKDKRDMQVMMHYYGCDDFLELMVQVMYDASDDVEDISKKLHDKYRERATQLKNILEEV